MLRVWGYRTHIRHAPKGMGEKLIHQTRPPTHGPISLLKHHNRRGTEEVQTGLLTPLATPEQALGIPPWSQQPGKPIRPSLYQWGTERPHSPKTTSAKAPGREHPPASRLFKRNWPLPSGSGGCGNVGTWRRTNRAECQPRHANTQEEGARQETAAARGSAEGLDTDDAVPAGDATAPSRWRINDGRCGTRPKLN